MMKNIFLIILIQLIVLVTNFNIYAKNINYKGGRLLIGKEIEVFEDRFNTYNLNNVLQSSKFQNNKQLIPNFDISNSKFWIKFKVTNNYYQSNLFLEVDNALINICNLYTLKNNRLTLLESFGTNKIYNQRKYKYPDFIFDLNIPIDSTISYVLEIKSNDQLLVPISLNSPQAIAELQNTKDIISGIHIGALLVMIFYNIFIYFSIRDKSYIFYVLYITFIGLTQITLTGYSYKYLFFNHPTIFKLCIVVAPSLAGISAVYFIKFFLNTKVLTPTLNKLLYIIIFLYIIALSLRVVGQDQLSSRAIDITALFVAVIVYCIAIKLTMKNYRPAKFFLFAWSLFIVGLILFVLRNLNILPDNSYTNYTMQVGTVLEVTLLSVALADKINIYKKEKELSQAATLSALQENDRIIREQNSTLERKVNERTNELVATNNNLNKTLTDLKETQTQLVEAEKMASLGQLTAGIAHEINNPINFVTSNVAPLRRDVDILVDAIINIESLGLSEVSTDEKQQQIEDYKEEIDLDYLKIEINHLLNGIHEGATRTADIVKGLKIFSRLDEDDLKKADINEGLQSTLTIANNLIGNKIQVIKNFGNIPLIECFPGKLNQVFLNMISNAVFAIQEKFTNQAGGILKITTSNDDQYLTIKIDDNGTGMSEATKKKIFEPFFTTKNVGVGTGLGMSIAYNTIKKHNAEIYLNSTEGVGTEFIIQLNLVFKEPVADYQSEQQR
ncbi:MAG: sensor histidine kinase [Janthinobacterium lividum]